MTESHSIPEDNVLHEIGNCPVPSTHDKLEEAHHFIHEMQRYYHEPSPFRFSLSAFLQAARSVTLMLQKELAHHDGFSQWWEVRRQEMADDTNFKLLNDYRVAVVHKNSLLPSSTAFVGGFRNGKPRFGLGGMRLDPWTSSVEAIIRARHVLGHMQHPHRGWSAEELGLQRSWHLQKLADQEVISFCISCWRSISRFVGEAHRFAGVDFRQNTACMHETVEYRNLRESQIFPEVARAWDGPPSEEITPEGKDLNVRAEGAADGEVLHAIPHGEKARGWITRRSRYWSEEYSSILLYSIGRRVISEKTCGFFETKGSSIRSIADPWSEHEEFESNDSSTE